MSHAPISLSSPMGALSGPTADGSSTPSSMPSQPSLGATTATRTSASTSGSSGSSMTSSTSPASNGPTHPVTRAQQGISKPKVYTDGTVRWCNSTSKSTPEALSNSNWVSAMNNEH
jgi:hypothetical protein